MGSIVTWFQFTSTTTDPGVLRDKNFLGEGAGHGERTVFQISTLSGVNLQGCTLLKEEEILIMPGTRFVIDGFTEWDFGVTEVRMRELPAGATHAPPAKAEGIYADVQNYLSLNPKFWRVGGKPKTGGSAAAASGGMHGGGARGTRPTGGGGRGGGGARRAAAPRLQAKPTQTPATTKSHSAPPRKIGKLKTPGIFAEQPSNPGSDSSGDYDF